MPLKDYDSTFDINKFLSFVKTHDLIRPTLFEVKIPGFIDEMMLCESTNLPGLTLLTKDVKYMGPSRQRALSIDYGGASLSMTFLLDGSTLILQKMHKWAFDTINPRGYYAKYDSEYKKDILIGLLKKTPEGTSDAIFGIKLVGAFPTSVGQVPVDSTMQSSIAKLTVTFAYRYWESVLYENLETVPSGNPSLPAQKENLPTPKPPSTVKTPVKATPKPSSPKQQPAAVKPTPSTDSVISNPYPYVGM